MMHTSATDKGSGHAGRASSALTAALSTAFACLAAWLILRHPGARDFLLNLAGHRPRGPGEQAAFLLAPRSVLCAGLALCAVCAFGLAVPALRRRFVEPMDWPAWTTALVVFVQCAVALAVVANGEWFFLRQFGRPAGFVPEEAVLAHCLPQAWPDSRRLLDELDPRNDRVAFRVEGDDRFFLPSLCYPLEFLDVWPRDQSDWRSDPAFAAKTDQYRLTHMLVYRPLDRATPISLTPLR